MPPKKAAKKAVKHHDLKHQEAKDLRRAYEHLGRVEILQRALQQTHVEHVSTLAALAEQELQSGHIKDAADLLRAAEHLSFAALAGDSAKVADVSKDLENAIADRSPCCRNRCSGLSNSSQIEEGPVGFSVTNLDDGVVSWRFLELGELPAVMITSPSDERMSTGSSESGTAAVDGLRVRATAWGKTKIQRVHANLEQEQVQLRQVPGSQVWEALLPTGEVPDGVYTLRIWAEDADGRTAEDTVRVLVGNTTGISRERLEGDQDNALPAWPDHGLLGTQLGPNKNGRKW